MDEREIQAMIDRLESALQMWIQVEEDGRGGMTKELLEELAGFEVRAVGTVGLQCGRFDVKAS